MFALSPRPLKLLIFSSSSGKKEEAGPYHVCPAGAAGEARRLAHPHEHRQGASQAHAARQDWRESPVGGCVLPGMLVCVSYVRASTRRFGGFPFHQRLLRRVKTQV